MRGDFTKATWLLNIFLIFVSIIGILFYPTKPAKALEWYENLLDDGVFINNDAMSLADIQSFLVAKNSVLANYSWGGKSAASWIYNESQEHQINPQVLLVTLQKEQSLITSSSASQNTLDCAMGYGASPSCAAMLADYRGFGNQVGGAAYMMRYNFNLGRGPSGASVGQRVAIQTYSWQDGFTNIYLSNYATAVLYRYTPYIYNGNYNFYNLFRSYFGGGTPKCYLAQTDSNPTVYLIRTGVKYPFDAEDTLLNWGFTFNDVRIVSASSLNSLSTGNPIRRVISNSSRIFYVTQSQKRQIINQDAATHFSIDMNSPSSLPDDVLSLIPTGNTLAYLVKGSGNEVYIVDNGTKHHIINQKAFIFWNLSSADVATISNSDLSAFSTSFDFSYVMKGSGEKVYFIDEGKKIHIRNQFTFNQYGFNGQDITVATDSWLNALPSNGSLWILAKTASNPATYLIDSSSKHHIPDQSRFQLWGFRWEDVAILSVNSISQIPVVSDATFLIKGSGAEVYFMDGGYKHWVPNLDIFARWGFHWDQVIRYSDDLVNQIWVGASMTNLVKGSGQQVYLMSHGYKYWISNPDVFSRWTFNWNDIRSYSDLLVNQIWNGGQLTFLIRGSSGRVYLVENGQRRWIISAKTFTTRGYKWSDVSYIADDLISTLPEGAPIK